MKFAKIMFIVDCVVVAGWIIFVIVSLNMFSSVEKLSEQAGWIALMLAGPMLFLILISFASLIISTIALEKNFKYTRDNATAALAGPIQSRLIFSTVLIGFCILFAYIH